MQKYYFLFAIYSLFMLTACHQHAQDEHDHDHDHDAHHEQEAAAEHAHSSDEIVFPADKAAAVGLEVETIQPAPFAEAIKVSGTILTPADKTQSVVAALEGVIAMPRPLTVGAAVRRGDVLATISVQGIAAADPLETARIQYEAARKEYERASRLVDDKIVSAQEMEQITLRYYTAKNRYEALQSKRATDGAIQIIAPQDGYITALYFANGDYVSAGQALLTVGQTHDLLLQVDVPERYWSRLGSVRTANFIPAYSDTVYRLADLHGRLLSVGRLVGAQAGYVPVVFAFSNQSELVPGAYADVYLLLSDSHDALSVPRSAITEDQGIHYIYIRLDESCYTKREVTLGQSNGDRVLVTSGLHAGETVVTRAAMQVRLAGSATVIPGHTHNH